MGLTHLYFIYGLCSMFYIMMAWFFWRKGDDTLSKFVSVLSLLVFAQCIKDLFFMYDSFYDSDGVWTMVTAMDMVTVPFYAFILKELCEPGSMTGRAVLFHIAPFALLAVLHIIFREPVFYYIEVCWAALYGAGYALWTMFAINRYHRRLKQRFSYEENINLNWLRVILISFFVILGLWIFDCVFIGVGIESTYMLGSLIAWMFICYFLYRHESVIDELCETPESTTQQADEEQSLLSKRIMKLFEEDRVFLNPHLKLSDIAMMTGSNRTYASRFFNSEQGTSFFEFVNSYRIRYAVELLKTSDEIIEVIAEKSGFNSRQSFHRAFSKIMGRTPNSFRSECSMN